MASPQIENGYTQIANELLEALYKTNRISPYEMRLFLFILRKTWGFKKTSDVISSRQFKREIGLDRRIIHKVLKRLINKNIIVTSTGDRKHITYRIQKDYEKWNLSPVETPPQAIPDLSPMETPPLSYVEVTKTPKVSPVETPTKEKKETSLKKDESREKGIPQTYPLSLSPNEESQIQGQDEFLYSKANQDFFMRPDGTVKILPMREAKP